MAYEITDAVLARAAGTAIGGGPPDYVRPVTRDGGYVLESSRLALTERPPMGLLATERRT